MNISEHLKKDFFVRKIPQGEMRVSTAPDSSNYRYPNGSPVDGEWYLTQTDFDNEINPGAHAINSEYVSRRAIYEADGETKDGKTKFRVKGYEPMERICLGKQKEIAIAKSDFFANFWVANETTKKKLFDTYQSYIDCVGLKIAFHGAVSSCNETGDGAMFLYRRGKNIEYKIFSHLFGDDLYYELDENRNPVIYRQYSLNGRNAVDVYSVERHETWVKDFDEKNESDSKWYKKVKNWFDEMREERSADGWRLVSRTKAQVRDYNQVIYWRVPDIPSGCVQQSIESAERTGSFLLEEFKEFASPTLVLKAPKINKLPPIGAHHRVLAIKGTADELGKSDVKTIMPPDGSNLAEKAMKQLEDNIYRSTMSARVDSDIFRAADPSSSAIKILYNVEAQWARRQEIYFHEGLKAMLEVFKQLVGQAEENLAEYAQLKLSCGFEVKLPQNQTEIENRIMTKVQNKVLSRKSAIQELGSPYLGDYEQINKETEEDLYLKSYIPTKGKSQAESEYGTPVTEEVVVGEGEGEEPPKPKIDNKAMGKNISN